MKKIFILIIMITLLIGCTPKKEQTIKTDAILFKEEYENLNGEKTNYNNYTYRTLEIDKDNPIIYKKPKDILNMIDNKETFAIYFGFASCPWCRSIIENLINVSKDLELNTIYYVDIKDIRDTLELDDNNNIITTKKGTDEYYKLLEKLNNILDDYTLTDKNGNEIITNEKRIYAPNIVSIINGVPTKMTTGISDIQENAYEELTEEIKANSYDKIKCTIECIVEEKEICSNKDKKC